ncbi:MAG: hypothetical protein KA003_17005 [Caldilineaceae bacterium]|nr:hypothetical protein [Caldilineaceae bacterium]MBP8108446.1 hypothetical protein [Caldilineaceae bacterium]MBP8121212.1 hypothetical protein [Caldilineaceae bacterium]
MTSEKGHEARQYADEKNRLIENMVWFNQFLRDSKELLNRMARLIKPEIGGESPFYYYPKSNFTPAIPDYFYMGMDGEGQTLHIYVVLRPGILNQKVFEQEPSFVVIRMFKSGYKGYATARGLPVISGYQSAEVFQTAPYVSGKYEDGIPFQSFQMSLDPFVDAENADVDAVIRRELIDRFKTLPDLSA